MQLQLKALASLCQYGSDQTVHYFMPSHPETTFSESYRGYLLKIDPGILGLYVLTISSIDHPEGDREIHVPIGAATFVSVDAAIEGLIQARKMIDKRLGTDKPV